VREPSEKPGQLNHGLPDAYGVSCRVRTERLSYASARRCRVAARFTPSARADTGSPVLPHCQDSAGGSAEAGFRRTSGPANQACGAVCDFRYILRSRYGSVNTRSEFCRETVKYALVLRISEHNRETATVRRTAGDPPNIPLAARAAQARSPYSIRRRSSRTLVPSRRRRLGL
jgi:hypothetical protein